MNRPFEILYTEGEGALNRFRAGIILMLNLIVNILMALRSGVGTGVWVAGDSSYIVLFFDTMNNFLLISRFHMAFYCFLMVVCFYGCFCLQNLRTHNV